MVPAITSSPALSYDRRLKHSDVVIVGGVVVFASNSCLCPIIWDVVGEFPD